MTRPPVLHYDPDRDRERQRRLIDAYRRLGTNQPECVRSDCNLRSPFSLTGADPEMLCYTHDLVAQGKNPTEGHHVAGQYNDDFKLRLLGADHEELSDLQRDWPTETLTNPNKSPLIRIAALLRGWLDILWLLIMRILGWVPAALETLDRILTEQHGDEWWLTVGWVTP